MRGELVEEVDMKYAALWVILTVLAFAWADRAMSNLGHEGFAAGFERALASAPTAGAVAPGPPPTTRGERRCGCAHA